MKIDPYKHKERYLKWKIKTELGIPQISKDDSDLIKRYLLDMERGLNISSSSVKGPRGFNRLNSLKDRLIFFSRKFEELYNLNVITEISESQLIGFFTDMRNGVLVKENGQDYKSSDTLARIFKAFWHWYQKTSKKNGVEIIDITSDLDTRGKKPEWVYLTENEIRILCDNAKFEYKSLIMFLFDTGIRSPTELMNVKVSDFFNDFKELNIREETSKTFGRRIKIMFSSQYIKDYISIKSLKSEDYLFSINPSITNQYLKRLAGRIFGDRTSPAGGKYSELTMYDFRHCSCCYWLPRYKSESALKFRFGWKKSDKIHYYSEMLGMRDTISEDDLLVDVTKTEIEKKLERSENEKKIMQERMNLMELKLAEIMQVTEKMNLEVNA
ncbi:MAG: hypothetical protein AABW89_03260 [Nanoarchaeota archaeon]